MPLTQHGGPAHPGTVPWSPVTTGTSTLPSTPSTPAATVGGAASGSSTGLAAGNGASSGVGSTGTASPAASGPVWNAAVAGVLPAAGGASLPVRTPPTAADIIDSLLWPKLLRTATLGLRGTSLGLSFATVAAVVFIDRVGQVVARADAGPIEALLTAVAQPVRELGAALAGGRMGQAGAALAEGFVFAPLGVLAKAPLAAVAWLLAAVVLALGCGAVCRVAAAGFAHGVRLPWTTGLRFAVQRGVHLVTATVVPLGFALGIAGLLWVGGLLLRVPGLDVLGAVLYGPMAVLGFAAAVALVLYVIGHGLLASAIACEGSDVFDATQRFVAYALARPGRLLGYWVILAGHIAAAAALVLLAFGLAAALTGRATGLVDAAGGAAPAAELTGAAKGVLTVWGAVGTLLAAAVVFSLLSCGHTVVYLLMRRLVDGQHESEVWTEATVGGTSAPRVGTPVAMPAGAVPIAAPAAPGSTAPGSTNAGAASGAGPA